MKLKILSLLIMLSSASVYSSAVHISSSLKSKNAEIKTDHLICLGKGWREIDFRIDTQINDLKVVYPKLFTNLSENEQNCFAPTDVPFGAQGTIDKILSLIDEKAKDNLFVSVDGDGSLAISDKEKDCYDCRISGNGSSPQKDISQSLEDLSLRNEHSSLGRKLLRAELLVGGVEIIGMGTLIALPRSITKWDEDWMDDSKRNLKRAWTERPVWDKDEWAINYIGHPVSGAIYYNALRSQGADRLSSFLFSTVQSTIWEYGFEAIAERPSIQDLIVTPVVGSVIGELAHMATMRMRKGGFSAGEKVLVTVLNPAYVLNNGFKTKKFSNSKKK